MTTTSLTAAQYAEIAAMGVATVYEAMGRTGLVDTDLRRIVPGSRVAGPARTVLCDQDDNRAVHEAMSLARPGDVLVMAMPQPAPVALIGDLLVTQAIARKVAGILVDAAVRDSDDLETMGLPVWSRFVRSSGATKTSPGRQQVPVRVGGALINPGDLVVLDGDGAVVVAEADGAAALDAARRRIEREAALRKQFESGVLSYELYGMAAEDGRAGVTDRPAAAGAEAR
jgi:4-hydroxy-4-methyl-2-oxoglutarate aldolase